MTQPRNPQGHTRAADADQRRGDGAMPDAEASQWERAYLNWGAGQVRWAEGEAELQARELEREG